MEIDGFYIVRHRSADTLSHDMTKFIAVFSSSVWLAFVGVMIAAICAAGNFVDGRHSEGVRTRIGHYVNDSWDYLCIILAQGPPAAGCCRCGRRFGRSGENTNQNKSKLLHLCALVVIVYFVTQYQGESAL